MSEHVATEVYRQGLLSAQKELAAKEAELASLRTQLDEAREREEDFRQMIQDWKVAAENRQQRAETAESEKRKLLRELVDAAKSPHFLVMVAPIARRASKLLGGSR